MKVKSVRFSMLRKTQDFENDRAECEVELGPKDEVDDAYALAISTCRAALNKSATTTPKMTRAQVERMKARALSRSVDVETFVPSNQTIIPRDTLAELCDFALKFGFPDKKDRW